MNFDFNNIAQYFGHFAMFYGLTEIARNAVVALKKYSKDNPTDVMNFYDSVINNEFKVGETITVEGYFMKFGQIVKPYTYINSVWNPTNEEDIKDHNVKHKGTEHELKPGEVLFERSPITMPGQMIPSYNDISFGFLYDERFTKYIKNDTPENIKITGREAVEDKSAYPILVIYDKKSYPAIINNYIRIRKGRIVKGSSRLDDYVKSMMDFDGLTATSNIYRPYQLENEILCISLLDNDVKVDVIDSCINRLGEDFRLPIFSEGTYDILYGMNNQEVSEVINSVSPNDMKYMGRLQSLRDDIDSGMSFLSMNGINITYRNPGTIGFYTEVEYFNEDEYQRRLRNYISLVKNFSIDFKNFSSSNFGTKERYNLTFLYDYSIKNLFSSTYINTDFSGVREIEKLRQEYSEEVDNLS